MLVTRLGQLEAPEEGRRVRIRVGDVLRDAAGRKLVDLQCPDAVVLRISADHERRWRSGRNRRPLSDEVGEAVFAYLGRDYASRPELVEAAPLLVRAAFRAFIRAPATHPVVRRWFCSNLVAQVYDDIGVSLVHEGPLRATPKKLLNSHVLTSIPSAVTRLALQLRFHRGSDS